MSQLHDEVLNYSYLKNINYNHAGMINYNCDIINCFKFNWIELKKLN